MRQAIKQYPKEMHVKRAKGVYTIHIHLDVMNIANIFSAVLGLSVIGYSVYKCHFFFHQQSLDFVESSKIRV